MRRKLNEGRSQIKRKYGDYSNIRVNEKAPIRNKIVNFIGKRFVTEEELKSELTKLTEETGKAFDERQWFKRNQRYFESFENRGQKVWTLSKYGKRVLEFINKPKENPVMENRSIGLFKNELFESIINEGALAKKGSNELDRDMQVMIDDADPGFKKDIMEICDKLGADPANVFQVDSESYDEEPLMTKIYKYLENNFRGTETVGKSSLPGAFSEYDPNLNVVRSDDYGFTGFYFTKDSNF
jgi:hypothetical protein